MKLKLTLLLAGLAVMLAGCYSDVMVTETLKGYYRRDVFIGDINCQAPEASSILRDSLTKAFIKNGVNVTSRDNATMILSGDVFLSYGSKELASGFRTSDVGSFYGSGKSGYTIESASFKMKDTFGEILLIATFNNYDRLSVDQVGYFLGNDIALKVRK